MQREVEGAQPHFSWPGPQSIAAWLATHSLLAFLSPPIRIVCIGSNDTFGHRHRLTDTNASK